ncbi:hypothetical protein LTS18_012363, partial [Coniosporium uncinatum]
EEEMTTPVHESRPRNVALSTPGGQSTRSSRSSYNAAADQTQAMMQTHRPLVAEELDTKLSVPSIHTGRSDRGDSVGFCASTVEDSDEFMYARLTPLSPKPMEDAEVSSYMVGLGADPADVADGQNFDLLVFLQHARWMR